ncbi:hypothetical protein VTN49DRAFT_1813 [Thermomyces lanuginosus]|uniref:uncharacterized protein n=1 Tax=Thermomyces lanuginosus TaxID=5541 RepID=UPI0037423E41
MCTEPPPSASTVLDADRTTATASSSSNSLSAESGEQNQSPSDIFPTGECRYIIVPRTSTADPQRCACQRFQRDDALPGAHCACGHQACYHAYAPVYPEPPEHSGSPTGAYSYRALVERIQSLETEHQHARRRWEAELREERRARREDVRVLREAMYSFFRFMERDVPRRFVEVEDRLDAVVDRQQRIQERLIGVDDASMALEERVARVEQSIRLDKAEEDDSDDEDDSDSETKTPEQNDSSTKSVPSPLRISRLLSTPTSVSPKVRVQQDEVEVGSADPMISPPPSKRRYQAPRLPNPPPLSLPESAASIPTGTS